MLLRETNLLDREDYLQQLIEFKDKDIVKIITGVRRCGKSSLMKLMIHHLESEGIKPSQILSMNFESLKYCDMTRRGIYEYVLKNINEEEKTYLFFDEIQRIPGWHDAVNSLRVDCNCDIYVTGSNSYLLSGDYATFLAGRYVEIKMLPLGFREFLEFNGIRIEKNDRSFGGISFSLYDENGNTLKEKELFDNYTKFGGMPSLADYDVSEMRASNFAESVYSTIVLRDILEREHRTGESQVKDINLLEKIATFLADNVGNNTSVTSIGNTLVNEKLIDVKGRNGKPATRTVQAYVTALVNSYLFYKIKRYDIKGKSYLKTLGKYYIVDTGIRNFLVGNRDRDVGHVLENIVFLELKRRGYELGVGKIGNYEIDFIATNVREKKYIQVAYALEPEEVLKRELTPLKKVDDNYEKIIVTGTEYRKESIDGIKIIHIIDFLLDT